MKVNNLRALDEFNKYACSQCKNRRAKWEGATMQANFGASKAAGRRAAGLAVAAVASGVLYYLRKLTGQSVEEDTASRFTSKSNPQI
jgi:hypothetical protein